MFMFDDFDTQIQCDELPEPFTPTAEDYMEYTEGETWREGAD